jgi:predicted acetyltransferase
LWEKLVAYHRALDSAMPQAASDGGERYAHRVENFLGDAHTRTYVAEVDGNIVGYVTGMILDMRPEMFVEEVSGMIGDIFVVESHRKQEVGKALVQAMEGFFSSRGIRYYEWFVATANEDGRAFWRSLGGRDVVTRMRAEIIEES